MSKIKTIMFGLAAFGILATPFNVLAGGYPAGDNSVAVVGVPGQPL